MEGPPRSARVPARVLNTVRDRALGEITPASPGWTERPLSQRVDWWVDRIERDLEAAAVDAREPPSGLATLGHGAQRAVRTLWRLARTFLDVQDLLEERPRGGLLARTLAKLPVVGVVGGWFDERAAIRKAAGYTQRLLT